MQVICRFARTCACIKGRRWPGSDRTCKYKLFAISTRFIWLDLSKILPFFIFINRPVYNFVSETSLPRETNRTRSIMDFFSIGNINGIQGQADCSFKINSSHQLHFIYLNQAPSHQPAKFRLWARRVISRWRKITRDRLARCNNVKKSIEKRRTTSLWSA